MNHTVKDGGGNDDAVFKKMGNAKQRHLFN